MLTKITRHRSRFITTAIAVAIVTAALLPGAWGTALAQTSGAPPEDPTPTATPAASPSASPTATSTTTTNPTTGTTTTTTTAADGTKTTETVRTDGTTATVVETPSGEKTTTVVVPNQGTVVVVEVPGEPVAVTVAPANPNTDTTMQLDVLGAQLSVPGGTLAADETIAIVEQSFNLAITLASTIDFGSSAAYVASIVNLASDSAPVIMPEVAAEPGTITGVRAFEISIAKLDGSTRALTNSIEIAWNFLPEHLAAAGGNFDNLLMLSFDPVTETWTQTTQLAQTTDSVTFEVTHSGVWAFAVRNATGAQAVPIPADTGTGIGETSDKTTAYLALAGVLAAIAVTSLGARAALRRTQG